MAAEPQQKTANTVIKPLDGGWGWVIVAGVFFIRCMSFGTLQSIGVTFDLLMAEFDCTKSEVGAVGSITFSLRCFLGPAISLLQDKFGTRAVVSAGSIFVSIGLILSAFVPNIYFLYGAYGVLGGIGMAMIYLPAMVALCNYFEKWRSMASALAGIGSYVGCFLIPYLMRFLIGLYGWRGCLFVLGAVTLNSLPAALLLRAHPVMKIVEKKEPENTGQEAPPASESDTTSASLPVTIGHPSVEKRTSDPIRYNKKGRKFAGRAVTMLKRSDVILFPFHPRYSNTITNPTGMASLYRSVQEERFAKKRLLGKEQTIPTIEENVEQPSAASKKQSSCDRVTAYFKELFKLFKNPEFTLFLLSNVLIFFVYYVPSLFIKDYGKTLGMPSEDTVILQSLVGPGNIVGRPIIAFIGDRFPKHRILLFGVASIISGLIMSVAMYFSSFYFMAFFIFQFAFLVGGTQSIVTPILADIVPLEKVGFAFGVMLAVQGAVILVGPPLLVLFPTYALTFAVSGSILVASGVILAVPIYAKRCFSCGSKKDLLENKEIATAVPGKENDETKV